VSLLDLRTRLITFVDPFLGFSVDSEGYPQQFLHPAKDMAKMAKVKGRDYLETFRVRPLPS
jgi:hypothetical protein